MWFSGSRNGDASSDKSDNDLNDIISLLTTTISKVNQFGQRCITAEKELCNTVQKSSELNARCNTLQDEVQNLKDKQCNECPKLKKYVLAYKHRVKEVESRLKSIASILNINSSESITKAYTIASQLVLPSEHHGKSMEDCKKVTDFVSSICSYQSPDNTPKKRKTDIPKKQFLINLNQSCDIPVTPTKEISDSQFAISPIIYKNSPKHKSKLDSSPIQFDFKENMYRLCKPKQNVGLHNEEQRIVLNSTTTSPNISPPVKNDSDKSKVVESTTTKDSEKNVWKLKKCRDISLSNKSLKQTLLGVSMIQKKQDITQTDDFNGGMITSQKELPSDNLDDTFFLPLTTSTCKEPVNPTPLPTTSNEIQHIQSSYDKVPKLQKSPQYMYRRDPVRKKAERRQLPGQDCDNCHKFYKEKGQDLSTSQFKKLMNNCSRHRDKYPIRNSTPPGFWNPRFDDSDEEIEIS